MSGPEQRVVDASVRELDRRGYWHFNISGANGRNGLPDRLVLIGDGRVLALEFKAPKTGRLSAMQRHVHEQWRAAGIDVLVVAHVDVLRAKLDEIERDDRARVECPDKETTGRRRQRPRP